MHPDVANVLRSAGLSRRRIAGASASDRLLHDLGSGLIDQSQNATAAAMQMAEKKA